MSIDRNLFDPEDINRIVSRYGEENSQFEIILKKEIDLFLATKKRDYEAHLSLIEQMADANKDLNVNIGNLIEKKNYLALLDTIEDFKNNVISNELQMRCFENLLKLVNMTSQKPIN